MPSVKAPINAVLMPTLMCLADLSLWLLKNGYKTYRMVHSIQHDTHVIYRLPKNSTPLQMDQTICVDQEHHILVAYGTPVYVGLGKPRGVHSMLLLLLESIYVD